MLEKLVGNYFLMYRTFFYVAILQVLFSNYMDSFHFLYVLLNLIIAWIKLSFAD